MDFQVGDVVKCINDRYHTADPNSGKTDEVSVGQVYEVLSVAAETMKILDDNFEEHWYWKSRFIKIEGPIAEVEVLY